MSRQTRRDPQVHWVVLLVTVMGLLGLLVFAGFTGGQVGGSLLAAVVLAVAGPGWAFLLNAFTYLGPAAAALLIRSIPPPDPAARRVSGMRRMRVTIPSSAPEALIST